MQKIVAQLFVCWSWLCNMF